MLVVRFFLLFLIRMFLLIVFSFFLLFFLLRLILLRLIFFTLLVDCGSLIVVRCSLCVASFVV